MKKIIFTFILFSLSVYGFSQSTVIKEPEGFIDGTEPLLQINSHISDDSIIKVITGGLPGIYSEVDEFEIPAYDSTGNLISATLHFNNTDTSKYVRNINGISSRNFKPFRGNNFSEPLGDTTLQVITGGPIGDYGDVDGGVVKKEGTLMTGAQTIFGVIKLQPSKLIQPLHVNNSHYDKIFGEENKGQQPENFKSVLQLQSEEYSQYNFTKQEQWDSLYTIKNPNASSVSKISHAPSTQACNLTKIVYGWNPYWASTTQYNNYDYSLLTDLCYFSYEVNANTGSYSSIHNWNTSGAVNNALAAGVRVSLCATLFSNHNTFLNSISARQNFITTMINLLQARGANGVNIDFEGMGSSSTTNFTQFMIDLCTQMHAAIPGSKISIAMPAVDWSSTMNIGALNPYVDLFIIMGYDYHWGSSANAGPVSPLYHGNYWGTICCSSSMAYYLNAGATPGKLCLGVPYYGYDYPTSTNGLNSTTTGNGTAVMYYTTKTNTASNYTQQWDNNSGTPYYMYNSSGWRQAWYDDETSLNAKYEMVNQLGIGGIGIWALGYDDGYTQCWDAIKNNFTTCQALQACSGTITDIGGPGNYFNYEDWTYTIAPQNANSVSLTFNSFDLELNYDFLYVYDGPNTTSPLIGTYTGTANPGTLTANSGQMTLRFTSDLSTVKQGFNATWNCVSSNAPANLSVVQNGCPSIGVTLNWTNSGNGWYVDVSDDPNFTTFYNKAVPNLTTVVCPGGFCDYPNCNAYLKFRPGTTYYWRVWNGSVQTNGGSFTTPVCTSVATTCTGNAEDTGGPSGTYSGNEDYIATAAPLNATSVTMTFTSFDLEANFDSLYIHDGPNTNSPLIGAYTGLNSPGTITANSGKMTLHFVSDPFVNNAGWTGTWTCTTATGINDLTSEDQLNVYPNPFNGEATVTYNLSAQSEVEIKLIDLLGKEIIILPLHTENSGEHKLVLDGNKYDLAQGMYMLKLRMDQKESFVKVVLQK